MVGELLTYSVRTALCIAVFYLFFKLLLSRETFHAFNRRLVMAATVLSFVLPLCVITVHRVLPAETATEIPTGNGVVTDMPFAAVVPETASESEQMEIAPTEIPAVMPFPETAATASATSITSATETADVVREKELNIPWQEIAGVIYLLGVVVVAGVTLRSVVQLRRLTRRGRCERLDDGTTLVRVDGNVTPISWCRNIVISERDLRENGEAILAHERAHIRLHHSFDLMLVDLAGAVQWFNPAMWLLRRDLRAIHEYEADAAVIASGVDARDYQLLLIRKAVGGRWYSIANSFNHSKLKNRITMMLQEKSSRRRRARALLLLPLAGLALGAFAETVYVRSDDKVTKEFPENASSFEENASVAAPNVTAIPGGETSPRGGNNADSVVVPDTIRSGKGSVVIEGGENLPPEVREQIEAFFESDEWKQGAQGLEKLGEYFESDEWRATMQTLAFDKVEAYFNSDEWKQAREELEKLGEYFESDEWKRKAETMGMAGKKLDEYFNGSEWRQKQQELESLGKYFESDEWKQAVREMTGQGPNVEGHLHSDEWRRRQQALAETAAEMKAYFESDDWQYTRQLMSEAVAKVEEYFNSDEWKALQKSNMGGDTVRLDDGTLIINNRITTDGRSTHGAIRTEDGRVIISDNWGDSLTPEERERVKAYFESDEWREAQAKLKEMGDYFSGDEWQKNGEALKRIGEYFNSDEWREAWEHAGQAAQSGDDAYFESDEWKAIKGKLDEWRAARGNAPLAGFAIEPRHGTGQDRESMSRDMAATQREVEADMAATQRRIMETERRIAETEDRMRRSGGNDRAVRREMKKVRREMEKVRDEMERTHEELEQARKEIEQSGEEIGRSDIGA